MMKKITLKRALPLLVFTLLFAFVKEVEAICEVYSNYNITCNVSTDNGQKKEISFWGVFLGTMVDCNEGIKPMKKDGETIFHCGVDSSPGGPLYPAESMKKKLSSCEFDSIKVKYNFNVKRATVCDGDLLMCVPGYYH